MYVINITDDYYKITSSIHTDYDNISSASYTNKQNNIEIFIPAFLLFLILCGPSFLCLIPLMVYTLIKPLFNNK